MNPVTGRPYHLVEMVCPVDPDSPAERVSGEIPVCLVEMVCPERGERTQLDGLVCPDDLEGLEIQDGGVCPETGVNGEITVPLVCPR